MRQISVQMVMMGTFFMLASTGRAADPAGGPPPAIDTLITQLGDKSFRVRQAAGRALEERGDEALPALREASSHTDEEIRRRAEVLTERIERVVLLKARRVTIAMKDRSIEDVVKEISRQTGYTLQYQGGQPRRLTIDMENVTYWQALEKVCNDAALSPGFDDQQGLVYLYQQDTISPYTYHTGPFRVVAQNFNYNRYVNLANIPRNPNPNNQFDHMANNLHFSFLIQSEPKVPLLSVGAPRLTKAEDENGVSLLARLDENQQVQAQYYDGNGMYRNFQHSTAVVMAKPAKDATQAKIIKGRVTVTLLSGSKPDVVIEKLAAGKKKFTGSGRLGGRRNRGHCRAEQSLDAHDVNQAACAARGGARLQLGQQRGAKAGALRRQGTQI